MIANRQNRQTFQSENERIVDSMRVAEESAVRLEIEGFVAEEVDDLA
jgi:hypothetical protein